MNDSQTYYNRKMSNPNLGIDIFMAKNFNKGVKFNSHWHENMQLYFFTDGEAIVECSNNSYSVTADSIIVINANELHSLRSLSDDLRFYIISINFSFLFSNQVDLCQAKFLSPLSQNQISFQHLIENDVEILELVNKTIREFLSREIGYELAIKSSVYQLIVLLLRNYISKFLTNKELVSRVNNINRFKLIFEYIDDNYYKKISTEDLANILNISTYHFCRIFKQMTGKTPTEYINGIRIDKAIHYLDESQLNITEIALTCGFDSINYFSRLFKKHYNLSPSNYQKLNRDK